MKTMKTNLKNLLFSFCLAAVTLPTLRAEIPLPDATVYGQITTTNGAPVSSGVLIARVQRGGAILEVTGEFKAAEGANWYVVRIPLETSIGAPGPSGAAAREGDALSALLVNGAPVTPSTALGTLTAGSVRRIDGTTDAPVGISFIRGDCSPDKVVNITDPVRLLGYLFLTGDQPPCLEACDSDGSGSLNITDAIFELSFLFLGGAPLPPPGPTCAVDPSPSSLGCASTVCN
jgi:hypothetical protein